METIKKKAREAWEGSKQVVVTTSKGEKFNGWISSYRDDSFAWEHPNGQTTCAFRNDQIADIRFVDEPEDTTTCQEAPESLLQKLEHARKYGYAVEVASKTTLHTGIIDEIMYKDGGPYQVGFDEESGGKIIYSECIRRVEIAYTQPESEPDGLEDVAKQRWEVGTTSLMSGAVCIRNAEVVLVTQEGATDEQIRVMTEAPEMLDVLESLERRSTLSRIQRGTVNADTIKCEMNPDEWRILTAIIKKARGEDA